MMDGDNTPVDPALGSRHLSNSRLTRVPLQTFFSPFYLQKILESLTTVDI